MTTLFTDDRLLPADVTSMSFPLTRFRRGIDEEEVQAFLERVASEMSRLLEERLSLQAQCSALQNELAGQRDVAVGSGNRASEDAVRILSQAQRVADDAVAESQRYAAWMQQQARERYEQIVAEARSRSGFLMEELQTRAHSDARHEMQERLAPVDLSGSEAMLRVFGDTFRASIRAQLVAWSQVLDDWERREHVALDPVSQDPVPEPVHDD
jgi:DivIVA domain-containing protein